MSTDVCMCVLVFHLAYAHKPSNDHFLDEPWSASPFFILFPTVILNENL